MVVELVLTENVFVWIIVIQPHTVERAVLDTRGMIVKNSIVPIQIVPRMEFVQQQLNVVVFLVILVLIVKCRNAREIVTAMAIVSPPNSASVFQIGARISVLYMTLVDRGVCQNLSLFHAMDMECVWMGSRIIYVIAAIILLERYVTDV
jgi:hypothetical protein